MVTNDEPHRQTTHIICYALVLMRACCGWSAGTPPPKLPSLWKRHTAPPLMADPTMTLTYENTCKFFRNARAAIKCNCLLNFPGTVFVWDEKLERTWCLMSWHGKGKGNRLNWSLVVDVDNFENKFYCLLKLDQFSFNWTWYRIVAKDMIGEYWFLKRMVLEFKRKLEYRYLKLC